MRAQALGAGADHLEGADHVDRIDVREILGRQRVEIAMPGEFRGAGIVDQDVDAAEFFHCRRGHLPAIRVGGDIALDHAHLGARLLHRVRNLFASFALLEKLITTLAPRLASPSATLAPMPEDEPVTIAALP